MPIEIIDISDDNEEIDWDLRWGESEQASVEPMAKEEGGKVREKAPPATSSDSFSSSNSSGVGYCLSFLTTSGNKLTIPSACGLPPKCCGSADAIGRDVLIHDIDRLSTLLRLSSVTQSSPAPSANPNPWIPFAPAPLVVPGIPISSPPVAPPPEAPAVTVPDSSRTDLNTLEFVVTVGFGTPARLSAVVFDTGSDVSWIQCLPCSGHCYEQHDPIFDPTKSATYAAVPCGHLQCTAAGGRCNGTTCLYNVEYGDGSSTSGVLSHEMLTQISSRTFPGFAFGCGQQNLGSFGNIDGLIGLGRGELSLSSQAAASFGTVFSKVQYTAMIQKSEHPSFYFVELVSIDIGGFILPVPPTVFTSTGTLLDSSTILFCLPTQA
ncbi:aspartyl protease family protein At5g10770-like [Phragmites australis]|uniref:aspartyl protease family protein At5g10770-like n=1 Tax=Phragmites australis TaxID=29695 RepID=UPI002D78E9DE|nr:aspartyl protease family protein At5g10770-like [Phragmites australis]